MLRHAYWIDRGTEINSPQAVIGHLVGKIAGSLREPFMCAEELFCIVKSYINDPCQSP